MILYYRGNQINVSGGNDSLDGKRILVMGDSNIQYFGDTLATQLQLLTGCGTVRNSGYAGATWATAEGDTDTRDSTMVGKTNKIVSQWWDNGKATDYDVVVIMMGTNDTDANAGEAEISSPTASVDVSTMCGSMHYCLRKLLYLYRESVIVGIIPPQSEYSTSRPTRFTKMKSVYDYYSIPTLDFWGEGQVVWNQKTENNMSYYLGDGIHLGSNGKSQFLHKLARFMETQV